MSTCSQGPNDKREFGRLVGRDLLKQHGKKRYYSRREVTSSCERLGYPVDWHCWAMCLYMSPQDFNTYHQSIGESCDLASMKSEMVVAMAGSEASSWFNIDLSWLEWPKTDLSSILDVDFNFFDWS